MNKWYIVLISYVILFGYMVVGLSYAENYVNSEMISDSNVSGYAVYNSYRVIIDVLDNGSLLITEEMDVHFNAYVGSFKFGYRILKINGYDDIINFEAYQLVDGSLKKLRTRFVKGFGKIGIKFYFNSQIEKGDAKFILKYVVVNAIWADGDKNYLRWIPFPEEHPVINDASFIVRIPRSLDVNVWTDKNIPIKIEKEKNRTLVIGKAGYLDSYETVRLEVSFEKFIEPPFSLRKYLSAYPILYIVIIIIFIYLLVISISTYRKRSKAEEIDVDRVLSDLDPIEFSYLTKLIFRLIPL